ncbi:MAG: ImmA/IrrE family metallo-endopeptidase [Lachnospiraceae bacterium]|nr:ImmA/IrrE family metallo-endopeptidase [Lachnospiraceae bacterium]
MSDSSKDIYCVGMTPEMLADKVLKNFFGNEIPSIPINPFKLMSAHGIVYQFMDFEELEGIYLVPETEEDVPVVGINYKRKITRQRFTAAHELCHHIKDRKNEACPIGSKNEIERYAENFAAELLMPKHLFRSVALEYAHNGKVTLDDALLIAERFGVSFRSCVLRLAFTLHMLDGDYQNLNQRISEYKSDTVKRKSGIDIENIELLKQAVDSYKFFFSVKKEIVWYKFKSDFIYHENRMEGLNLDREEVAEIVADLRMNRQESAYCKESYEEIIQVVGHSDLYDYVLSTNDRLSIYKLLYLNKILFRYAPFPEEAGKTRTDNNFVLGAKFETVDWRDVANELVKLQIPVENLLNDIEKISVSDYLTEVVKIHHKITQIHPFHDGNGRSSRAMLNWMLRIKGLPPIYIKVDEKDKYYEALELADAKGEYKELLRVVIRELFRTVMKINSNDILM